MFRGFYTAGSGMIAQQRRTELLANNLANVHTPGFKADQSSIRSFPEMFMSSLDTMRIPTKDGMKFKGLNPIGSISTGVYMQETLPLFMQGQLQETNLTTDVALIDGVLPVDEETNEPGAVFYILEREDGGQAYTKNGNFALDPYGFLTHPLGYYVLDTNGNRIQLQNDDFQIAENGVIYENDTQVATLGVAFADQPSSLLKQGNGLFMTEEGELPLANNVAGVSFSFQQGFIEQSNVDAGRSMTDMLTAYRTFEANQKILQAYDRSMEKAVDIGRIN